MLRKTITIDLMPPSSFSSEEEYQRALQFHIKRAVPDGYRLVCQLEEVEPKIKTIEKHYAEFEVEEADWKGISVSDRTLWFGVAKEGMEAPWITGFGACLVKIWDIRRREDGVVEYGIGNRTRPSDEDMAWVTGDKFFDEWPD